MKVQESDILGLDDGRITLRLNDGNRALNGFGLRNKAVNALRHDVD